MSCSHNATRPSLPSKFAPFPLPSCLPPTFSPHHGPVRPLHSPCLSPSPCQPKPSFPNKRPLPKPTQLPPEDPSTNPIPTATFLPPNSNSTPSGQQNSHSQQHNSTISPMLMWLCLHSHTSILQQHRGTYGWCAATYAMVLQW